MEIYKIKINFEEAGHASVELPIAEGESVLDVCLENGIELQHNCGGVCGCSTCHVYVNKGMDNIQEISDKEEDFIDRAVNPRTSSSRLGFASVWLLTAILKLPCPGSIRVYGVTEKGYTFDVRRYSYQGRDYTAKAPL